MSSLTRLHRVYYVAVGVFALWVGAWGFFSPNDVERALPWQVPPLHARFIASMYLSGTVVMLSAAMARRLHEVRIVTVMAAVWTGMLLVVSLFHLPAFEWTRVQVWFWFFAYVAFPLAGGWLAWHHRSASYEASGAAARPVYLRAFLVIGAVCLALALGLFLAPQALAELWPWPIDTLLAQIYSGPFLSYGVGGLLLSRCTHQAEMRLPVLSVLSFTVLVLVASVLHREVFDPLSASAIVWFAGFAIVAAVSALTLGDRVHEQEPSDG